MIDIATIRQPVEQEMAEYSRLFQETLSHEDDLLGQAMAHVRQRRGKMMRPLLLLLVAREFGAVPATAVRAAVTVELLHTASLIHDDVVDDSAERRGQAAEHTLFGNKVAILVGDFLLSRSLQQAALTGDVRVVEIIAKLGGALAEGEVMQLANIRAAQISEQAYFEVIGRKTAALFKACARLGALTAGASAEMQDTAARLGAVIGECFQIRDDIFDYYENENIGKPTGNDMAEGKLTLPVIYAVNSTDRKDVTQWAARVKQRTATTEDIRQLVEFTKATGGIEYAHHVMQRRRDEAQGLLQQFQNTTVRESLVAFLDYTIGRSH